MSLVVALRHELPCDPTTYWERCVLDRDYNRELFLGELGFVRYDILWQRDAVRSVRRSVRAEPSPEGVPGFLKNYLAYVEEGDLDRARSLYSFRTVNEAAPGKIDIRGYMHAQAAGSGRCVRTTEIHVEVTMFGLGGFVEKRLAEDLTKSYEKSAEFTARWLR
jgi:hypothetical protein